MTTRGWEVATWRHREMEDALGGPIDHSMTVEKVRQIVAEFSDESEFVDFKSKGAMLGERSNRNRWRVERSKDVAAFANARGGVIVFGVRDAKAAGPGDRLEPFTTREAEPGELIEDSRKAVREVTTPIPGFDMFPVHDQDASEFYIICVVPPSAAAPHAVKTPGDGRNGLIYPSRAAGESHTVYLHEFQVAELYERRARSGEDRRRRAEAVWTEGLDALDVPGAPRVWMAVASVPDLPREDLLTEEAQQAIDQWDKNIEPFPTTIRRGWVRAGEYPVPAPGRVCFTEMVRNEDGEQVSVVRNFYREIHADGSAFAALPLSGPGDGSPFTIVVDELVDDVATTTANTLAWTASRTGLWGATTVTAGIVVAGTDDAVLQIDGLGGLDIRRTIHRRVERRWPRAVTVVELADTVTMQGRMVVAYRLATPLVQAFGVPKLAWLTEDGGLCTFHMLRDGLRAATDWATRHGVPLDHS
ncbi:MAG TPA: ATP-binding protein [Mycobacterium sp.]|nr:ATP-binding protein [Mycobacterium sp.]